jgi:tripartite-type tricarboxylate transporter receptor subunit TctC
MVVPARTPAPIVARLNAELNKALHGDLGKQLSDYALQPMGGTPEEMTALIRKDQANYGKILKEAGVQPQ